MRKGDNQKRKRQKKVPGHLKFKNYQDLSQIGKKKKEAYSNRYKKKKAYIKREKRFGKTEREKLNDTIRRYKEELEHFPGNLELGVHRSKSKNKRRF